MATEDIVGGLFGINPAMYQQQQQKQVFDRAVALQNLDPFQQAAVGYQQAGYNLAGALGGALGGVDPQLQRISALNAISKQIDQSNPESIMNGAKMLADAGFTQEALGLAQYARKANSELALAKQRMNEGRAATTTKDIQNAEYAANLRVVLGELESGPQTADTPRQIALIKARLEALPQQKEASTTTDAIKNAEYSANILVELDKLKSGPQTADTPRQIALLEARLKSLPQPKDAAVSTNIQDSVEIGRLVGEIDKLNKFPEGSKDLTKIKQLEAQLRSLTKNTKQGEFAQILEDAGYIPGSEDYINKMKEFVNLKLAEKPETNTEAMKNAISFADLSPYKKGTPEYNEVLSNKFKELTGKAAAADKANIAEIGVSPKGDAVYFDKNTDQQFIVKIEGDKTVRVPYAGSVNRATSNVSATATSAGSKVNAYVPASETAQQDFIKSATAERATLRNAPDTIANIEAAKQLIPTASTFMGKGGEPLLAAASFLNNRLGFSISTKGVTDATVLRTRLFEGILDNLKKLDSQPSQEQQRVLSEALGNLGTDPAALEQILDRISETVRARVERYNTDVTEAEGRGVKFPFIPQLKLPPRKAKLADGAALIPTGKSAAAAIPQGAIDALKAGQGTDAQFDEQFGAGAAKRVRGAK
jgi:hypothetical protein